MSASAETAAARPRSVDGKNAVRGVSGKRRVETSRREQSQMKALFLFQRSKDKEDELKLGSGGFGGGSSSEGKRRKEGVEFFLSSP